MLPSRLRMVVATPTQKVLADPGLGALSGAGTLALSPRPNILVDRVHETDLAAFNDIEQLQKKVRGCTDLEVIPSFTLQNLAEGCGQVVIARDHGKTVGYAFSFLRQDPESGSLIFFSVPIGVDPEYRGYGVGMQLVEALHQDARNRKIDLNDWRPNVDLHLSGLPPVAENNELPVRRDPVVVAAVSPSDHKALKEIEHLQRKIWGYSDLEIIPGATLRDLASGCGQLFIARCGEFAVGFAFTFLKKDPKSGEQCFYLDLVGVDPNYQDRGIGRDLMQALREDAVRRGIPALEWRYDGLETRNARLYLGKIGAQVVAFKPNSYGIHNDTQSDGLPTDRFVVRWDHLSENPRREFPPAASPVISVDEKGSPVLHEEMFSGREAGLSMAVPLHFQKVKDQSLDTGREWIAAFRRASTALIDAGYQIIGFRAGPKEHGEYLWAHSNGSRH